MEQLLIDDITTKRAVERYLKHKQIMKNYNAKNREVINQRAKEYYQKLKEDPTKYEEYKTRQCEYKRIKREQKE
jgi:hypothetical protein